MSAHARLSPSGAKGWFACPGKITLEAPIPNESTTYSDDGTAMHEVAAWCLTEHRRADKRIGDWIVVSHEGEPERKVKFTEDMADLVQGYVETVYNLTSASPVDIKLVEQRVEFSEFVDVPDQFGTADFIAFNKSDGELVVCDLKTGRTPVEVKDNPQLMFYALGALALLRDNATDVSGPSLKEIADKAGARIIGTIATTVEADDADLF